MSSFITHSDQVQVMLAEATSESDDWARVRKTNLRDIIQWNRETETAIVIHLISCNKILH